MKTEKDKRKEKIMEKLDAISEVTELIYTYTPEIRTTMKWVNRAIKVIKSDIGEL